MAFIIINVVVIRFDVNICNSWFGMEYGNKYRLIATADTIESNNFKKLVPKARFNANKLIAARFLLSFYWHGIDRT